MAARSRIAACLCVLACALAAGATAAPSTLTPPGPHFRPASGWLIVKPTATEQPVSWRSMIVAVTTHDAAAAHPFLVFTSLTRLSKRGILIWAMTIGRNRRPSRRWHGRPGCRASASITAGKDSPLRMFSSGSGGASSTAGTWTCASTSPRSIPTRSFFTRRRRSSTVSYCRRGKSFRSDPV